MTDRDGNSNDCSRDGIRQCLIEPTHNARFVALMDGAMPQWRVVREQLNRLPVRHDEWVY